MLDVQNDKALIITVRIVTGSRFNALTWEACTPRKYLNGIFLENLKKQKDRIIETHVINNNNLWYGTPGGKDTDDKIFLLSIEEADKYFGDSGDYSNKRSKGDGSVISNDYDNTRKTKAGFFSSANCWLRSPGQSGSSAAYVCNTGCIFVGGGKDFYGFKYGPPLHSDTNFGIRPALWLKT